jgi:hypothetical protein
VDGAYMEASGACDKSRFRSPPAKANWVFP